MEAAILALIISGAAIMIGNIVAYILFIFRMKDVLSSGKRKDNIWLLVGLALLLFFLAGYLVVGLVFDPVLLTAFILFFGSIFVSIMLFITSNLLVTAKERSMEITQVLIDVVDARDPNLNGHSRHVKDLVMVFYYHLPFSIRKGINPVSLEYAASLHDIGKLGVPESILNKPGKLTEEEWDVMKTHPKRGVQILEPLKTFEPIKDWICFHHERADGNGYYKISPKKVPIPAKMLSIVDTYSAITMRRSYKAPRTHEEAIQIIKDVAGTQLDKYLVEIFVNIPKEELMACIPETIKN